MLEQDRLRPWQLFLAVKWLELEFHLTPRGLLRLFLGADRLRRRQRRWVFRHIAAVWVAEVIEFFFAACFRRTSVACSNAQEAKAGNSGRASRAPSRASTDV